LLLSAPLSLKPSCLLKPQTQCDSLLKNGGAELRIPACQIDERIRRSSQ
jgi:hypothetical protein